jgi:hypothetical protein
MSTHDTSHQVHRTHNSSRWAIPVVAVLLGVAYLVAGLLGDNLGFGIFGLLLMVAVGGVVLLAGRYSETVAGLMDRRDERINALDETASLLAGMAVLAAVLLMFVVEVAQGRDGSPYFQLGALGGLTYLVALVYQRFRR